MSNDIILKVENLSKQYRLGVVGTGTIGHDLNRFWHKIRGKEDPYLKIGAVNDRSATASSEYVWALQDINFEVKRGEILGIIGKNGAGKSTLLKILSRVTAPTTGSIKTRGRIASLLEVGTGMHPELTGRENVYLNGAILGMTKAEIASKIDDIIEFSGCEMYIDTPVKRYSSGMRVRLGFAVAAFLEPDILVVDEVLAVGDAEFQKKAIGKMQDISNTSGRTVLFVSHNMAAVQDLCTRCVVLENGYSTFNGDTKLAVNTYLKFDSRKAGNNIFFKPESPKVLKCVSILSEDLKNIFDTTEEINFRFDLLNNRMEKMFLSFYLRDKDYKVLFFYDSQDDNSIIRNQSNVVTIKIPNNTLVEGDYLVTFGFRDEYNKVISTHKDKLNFTIIEELSYRKNRPGQFKVTIKMEQE